jgi:hypothetical protein
VLSTKQHDDGTPYTNLPIPDVSLAERKVNINLNGRQAIPTGQQKNPSAVKYPYATSEKLIKTF